jgi:hypothetical protein
MFHSFPWLHAKLSVIHKVKETGSFFENERKKKQVLPEDNVAKVLHQAVAQVQLSNLTQVVLSLTSRQSPNRGIFSVQDLGQNYTQS